MKRVTWVLEMARRGKGKERSAADVALLEDAATRADNVRREETSAEKERKARNRAILKASKKWAATEIAEATGIKQSYISRIIRSDGKPESGSALDQGRDKEPVSA